jgi:hypothetical protein
VRIDRPSGGGSDGGADRDRLGDRPGRQSRDASWRSRWDPDAALAAKGITRQSARDAAWAAAAADGMTGADDSGDEPGPADPAGPGGASGPDESSDAPRASEDVLRRRIADLEAESAAKDTALASKDTALAAKDTALTARDATIGQRDAVIMARDAALAGQDAALAEKDALIEAKDAVIARQWRKISELDYRIDDLSAGQAGPGTGPDAAKSAPDAGQDRRDAATRHGTDQGHMREKRKPGEDETQVGDIDGNADAVPSQAGKRPTPGRRRLQWPSNEAAGFFSGITGVATAVAIGVHQLGGDAGAVVIAVVGAAVGGIVWRNQRWKDKHANRRED